MMTIIAIPVIHLPNSHSSLDLLTRPYKASAIAAAIPIITIGPNGWACTAPFISPLIASKTLVVIPHEGQGMPVILRKTHVGRNFAPVKNIVPPAMVEI